MLKPRLLSLLKLCRAIFLCNGDYSLTVQIDFFFNVVFCIILEFWEDLFLMICSKYLYFQWTIFMCRKKKEDERKQLVHQLLSIFIIEVNTLEPEKRKRND